MDQLARVHRASPAAVEDPADDLLLDGPLERGLDQPSDLVVPQTSEVEPTRAGVLPQRDDGVRTRLTDANGRDHECVPAGGQLQHERRRYRVEPCASSTPTTIGRPLARSWSACTVPEAVGTPDRTGPHRAAARRRHRAGPAPRSASPAPTRSSHRFARRSPTLRGRAATCRFRRRRTNDPTAPVGAGVGDPRELILPPNKRPLRSEAKVCGGILCITVPGGSYRAVCGSPSRRYVPREQMS